MTTTEKYTRAPELMAQSHNIVDKARVARQVLLNLLSWHLKVLLLE
jgi:hypothetical protein